MAVFLTEKEIFQRKNSENKNKFIRNLRRSRCCSDQ